MQAGDNNHFHPTCARCTKCGDPFGDGEEMYLQVDTDMTDTTLCHGQNTRYAENCDISWLVVMVLKVVTVIACHEIKRYLRISFIIILFHCRTQVFNKPLHGIAPTTHTNEYSLNATLKPPLGLLSETNSFPVFLSRALNGYY